MRKITRGATAFALSTTMTWLLGGCCEPGPPPPSGPDMTPPPSGPDMASLPPTDEACDVGRSSAGCARRILAGAWKVHGLTHDGHALVSDDAGALSAVRLADG